MTVSKHTILNSVHFSTGSGVIGGTVFGVFPHLPVADVLTTVFMALIGAVTSFIVSMLLKVLWRWWFKE